MILFLLAFFEKFSSFSVPAVFYYASTRMILAALTTLCFTIFLGPPFIRKLYEFKIGQVVREKDCPVLAELHGKKKDTPTMGGVLILAGMLIALLLWMDFHSLFTWIFLFTTLFVGGIGAYDDYLKVKHKNSSGLKGKKKLFLQVVFAAFLGGYLLFPTFREIIGVPSWINIPVAKEGAHSLSLSAYSLMYYIPFVKDPIFALKGIGALLSFCMVIFVITGASNAVNLTDGLDGLAAGCLVMVSVVLALVAFFSNNIELSRYLNILYIEESSEIAVYLFALAGACLGFLWFNGSPAQVFMGDTGSLALGAILGVASILLRREFLFALAGGVFVIETLSVIIQVLYFRMTGGKRVFLCTPLHHHFEYKKWPETKVVLRFWIVSLLLCLIAIISLKMQ